MRLLVSALLVGFVAVGYIAVSTQQVQNPSIAGVLAGRVVDGAGTAIAGARVELRTGQTVLRTATTDARGDFRFDGVAAGTFEVRVTAVGFVDSLSSVSVVKDQPTPAVTITLRSASSESDAKGVARMPAPPPPVVAEMPMAAPAAGRVGGVAGGVMGGVVGNAAVFDQASVRRQSAPYNTEAYDKIDEHRFRRVADDPLSTFSIDVDTASYSNVRRFLNAGTLPPADAVRIEELINYFRFSYANASSDAPFSVTTEVAACPWNPRHRLALVGLQARRLEPGRTPPRNLVFLLDVSGSMAEPDKLPLVKTAMRMLVDTLNAEDRVAIVVYAGASGVALPSTPGSRKADMQRAIAELQPGGSTNGAAGIQLAYDLAAQNFIKGGINRVILATDGDFNVGVTSQGELIRLIEEKREKGVFLSVLGVGTGNVKDSTMEKLADKGNGNYAYLDSLHEARRVLIAEAGATLVTVAKDVKIQVEFNPRAVGAYKLIGYENRMLAHQDFNDDKKDAGEIGAGHTVTALYEIVPPGEPIEGGTIDPLKYQDQVRPNAASKSDELMTVKLRYKQPDGDTSRLMSVVVRDRAGDLTPNLGFASAVAEFGMLLRKSEFRGQASWSSAQDLARRFRGDDPDGYRAEFVRLIDLAAALDAQNLTSPQSRR
jgi:Ca-activated chloride channel family protein